MTEPEWLTGSDPDELLKFAGRTMSNRQRRLFACACYRHVPRLLKDERCLRAVEVSERYADGGAGKVELCRALNVAFGAFPYHWPGSLPTARYAEEVRHVAARAAADGRAERVYQAELVRDIVSNPFRRFTADPGWRSPAVVTLARALYEGRQFDELPVLADALEEAGCESAALLGHLRSGGPHVCGCWALDLVLEKG